MPSLYCHGGSQLDMFSIGSRFVDIMGRGHQKRFILIAAICLLWYFGFIRQQHSPVAVRNATIKETVLSAAPALFNVTPVDSECLCRSPTSGNAYDFCYRAPFGTGKEHTGQRFDCSFVPAAEKLGLLDETGFVELEKGGFTLPTFVIACNEDYWEPQIRLIRDLQQDSQRRIILYDLGLKGGSVNVAKQLCGVEYRRFRFEDYPLHLQQLKEYRWKPVIIAEAVKEFGTIWWMDSSIVPKRWNMSDVYDMLRCHDPSYKTADASSCNKFPFLLPCYTGHGTYSATNPLVYKYIPTDENRLKQKTSHMWEANVMLVSRTRDVVRLVLKWFVLCALEKDCMAPENSYLSCRFPEDRYGVYANCHRFDQAVVNLLLSNTVNFEPDKYGDVPGVFDVKRGFTGPTVDDLKKCANPA